MKKEKDGQVLFSATDLANHLGCVHLTTLERQVADGLLTREFRHAPMLELLIELLICQNTRLFRSPRVKM
jgi:hypothetical protein